MEIETKLLPPQHQHVTNHSVQLLNHSIQLMSPRSGAPASPVLASTSVMNLHSREPRHSEKRTPAPDSVFHFYCNSYSHMNHFLTYPLFIFQKPNLWACDNLPGWVTYYIIIHMPNPTSLERPEKNSGQQNKFLIVTYPGWLSTSETLSHCWDNKHGFSKRSPSLCSGFSFLQALWFPRHSVGRGV